MAGRVGALHRRALRAAPRADLAVTAIRLQSLTPSRLRHCALRLPPGESPAGYPRRTGLAPLDTPNRLSRIGHASAGVRYSVSLFFATVSNSWRTCASN